MVFCLWTGGTVMKLERLFWSSVQRRARSDAPYHPKSLQAMKMVHLLAGMGGGDGAVYCGSGEGSAKSILLCGFSPLFSYDASY